MRSAPDRRQFLQSLLGGAAGVFTLGRSASAAASPLTTSRLTPTLALISGAGGNVLVASGPDSLVMVNGGARAHVAALLAEVAAQFGGVPVRTLFNTDWHPDHSGSNEALRQAGATVIAHEYTKQYLARTLPKMALPTKTTYASDKLPFGAETIEYGSLGQAHTDGDIYVLFRAQNVLAAGDLLSVGAYPIADYASGGWLGGMVTATKAILDLTNAETRFVPGTGPVQTRADVEAQHQMLVTMRDRIGKMMRQGLGAEDMLAAGVTKDYDAKWGNPRAFIDASYRGMWLHVRELGGVV